MQPVAVFYGLCALLALAATIASGRRPLVLTSAVLIAAWAVCNAITLMYGFARAPLFIPEVDAILSLLVAGIAAHYQSRVAAVVFGLFLLVQLVHVAAFRAHTQGTYFYFLTLNLLFLAQLAVAGGSGVALVIARLNPAPRMADRFSRVGIFAGRRTRGG